jgi:ribonuclease HI
MLLISIDGACRRNGKPDCVSAGGVFIQQFDKDLHLQQTSILTNYEIHSTNQRGELLALLTALDYIWSAKQYTQIITDSEYLFNTMTKGWYKSWQHKGWVTAAGEPVKNRDLWQEISKAYSSCEEAGIEIMFYHIKGHCIPFGKVTANTLLTKDTTGARLMAEVLLKYDVVSSTTKKDLLEQANALSERNNGFKLPPDKLRQFVVSNVIADAIATKCVEAADALLYR